ncbi:hypothetical protein CMV_021936 [Castanea mollissima]|uniref:Uncharacterized protein n=1 Tax=Castanea mollissima TaxID=60419 RepID=A0A8J4VL41_9ROSI|nr:hypothetical protein CMV_021936 [Castanea mollissima]
MDSLYSGLKALEGQTISKKGRLKLLEAEEMPAPIVRTGPQNRTKDGNSGEDFNKDSIGRDERRLTELGRRTVEIFVLAHIFRRLTELG